jgi:hypothetical protein
MRASDAERESAVRTLQANSLDGRLTVDELSDRTAQALAAVTVEELAALLADLPAAPAPPEPRSRRKRPWIPGRISFSARWTAAARPDEAAFAVLEHVAPGLRSYGFELVDRTPYRLVFAHERRPVWTILVAVITFPVGLLALLYTDTERITIELAARGKGTVMLARGVARLSVRQAFDDLEST